MSLYEFETGRFDPPGGQTISKMSSADHRELYLRLHEKMSELKADGVEVPEDMEALERELFAECCAESQGR